MQVTLASWRSISQIDITYISYRSVPSPGRPGAKNIDDIISLDPAQVFEFTGGELIANIYDRITMYEPENLAELVGGVAETWAFSEDGKTITLKLRPGLKFHSGNPVTAEDVAWSLQRVIKLDQSPSFILSQFGWSADNVDDLVNALDDSTVQVTITEDFSPGPGSGSTSPTLCSTPT